MNRLLLFALSVALLGCSAGIRKHIVIHEVGSDALLEFRSLGSDNQYNDPQRLLDAQGEYITTGGVINLKSTGVDQGYTVEILKVNGTLTVTNEDIGSGNQNYKRLQIETDDSIVKLQ